MYLLRVSLRWVIWKWHYWNKCPCDPNMAMRPIIGTPTASRLCIYRSRRVICSFGWRVEQTCDFLGSPWKSRWICGVLRRSLYSVYLRDYSTNGQSDSCSTAFTFQSNQISNSYVSAINSLAVRCSTKSSQKQHEQWFSPCRNLLNIAFQALGVYTSYYSSYFKETPCLRRQTSNDRVWLHLVCKYLTSIVEIQLKNHFSPCFVLFSLQQLRPSNHILGYPNTT